MARIRTFPALFVMIAAALVLSCGSDGGSSSGDSAGGGGGGGGGLDCDAACQQISACFGTMDPEQCRAGCAAEASAQSAACGACMSMSCGQEFGCCLVRNCGTPEDALGLDCS